MTSQAVIGVDIGTTAAKVTAFVIASGQRISASREYPLQQPQPGWEVQDPDVMMAATIDALAECVAALDGVPVVAVGLSTAMHGLIGLGADRRPVTPLVTWADSRAAAEADLLRLSGVASAQRSGTPVHAMAPLAKIRWFVDHEPQTTARVRWWVGLKDYLVLTLTGDLVTERSCASGTGLMSLATGDWDADLVEASGTTLDHLPPIRSTTDQLALSDAIAARVGLPAGTPVVLGAGDGPMGNLGVGALEPGVAGLSLGTSGAIRMVVPRPPTENDGSLFCYALTDDAWVVGGAVSNGGMVARWAGQAFLGVQADQEPRDADLVALAASAPAGCDGLVMIPYLMGERAPLWNPSIPGAYLGLRRGHTPAHLARAAIEGVGLQLGTLLDGLERVHPVREVRATGGVFRSELWREIVAGCLDRPVVLADAAEGSGLGAAALALCAIGQADSLHGAVALLGVDTTAEAEGVTASEHLVHTYREARASVHRLLDALAPVAAVMNPHPHA